MSQKNYVPMKRKKEKVKEKKEKVKKEKVNKDFFP